MMQVYHDDVKCDQCGMLFNTGEALSIHKQKFCIGIRDSGVNRYYSPIIRPPPSARDRVTFPANLPRYIPPARLTPVPPPPRGRSPLIGSRLSPVNVRPFMNRANTMSPPFDRIPYNPINPNNPDFDPNNPNVGNDPRKNKSNWNTPDDEEQGRRSAPPSGSRMRYHPHKSPVHTPAPALDNNQVSILITSDPVNLSPNYIRRPSSITINPHLNPSSPEPRVINITNIYEAAPNHGVSGNNPHLVEPNNTYVTVVSPRPAPAPQMTRVIVRTPSPIEIIAGPVKPVFVAPSSGMTAKTAINKLNDYKNKKSIEQSIKDQHDTLVRDTLKDKKKKKKNSMTTAETYRALIEDVSSTYTSEEVLNFISNF